jgi:hypothetical protein
LYDSRIEVTPGEAQTVVTVESFEHMGSGDVESVTNRSGTN